MSTDTYRLTVEGLPRPVLVDSIHEGGGILQGDEVTRQGVPTGRRHVIASSLIRRRVAMRMDNHYGRLVPC